MPLSARSRLACMPATPAPRTRTSWVTGNVLVGIGLCCATRYVAARSKRLALAAAPLGLLEWTQAQCSRRLANVIWPLVNPAFVAAW